MFPPTSPVERRTRYQETWNVARGRNHESACLLKPRFGARYRSGMLYHHRQVRAGYGEGRAKGGECSLILMSHSTKAASSLRKSTPSSTKKQKK